MSVASAKFSTTVWPELQDGKEYSENIIYENNSSELVAAWTPDAVVEPCPAALFNICKGFYSKAAVYSL